MQNPVIITLYNHFNVTGRNKGSMFFPEKDNTSLKEQQIVSAPNHPEK